MFWVSEATGHYMTEQGLNRTLAKSAASDQWFYGFLARQASPTRWTWTRMSARASTCCSSMCAPRLTPQAGRGRAGPVADGDGRYHPQLQDRQVRLGVAGARQRRRARASEPGPGRRQALPQGLAGL
ncbi:hypothetical protein LP419_24375 [Massilia sp. H-1]|nr:hypothetical protein LP419_24375 [Massilia sp. H-1]